MIKTKKNKEKKAKFSSLKNILKKIKIFRNEDETDTYSFKEMVIVMFVSIALGFFACFGFIKIFNSGKDYIALSGDLSKLVDTYYALVDNYYEDINKEVLVDDAIKGMLSSVDDMYTNYSDTDTTTTFLETVEGTYDGIGCSIRQDENGTLIVAEVFDGGPSSKAGLLKDDIVLKVDDKEFKNVNDMSTYIKENSNDEINLIIKRDDEEKQIKITKSKVEIPTVTSEIYEQNDKKIGYISISIFSSVANKQFNNELDKLNKQNIEGLIIDVRNNGGGYLSVVSDISSRILKKNSVIYQLQKDDKITIKKDVSKECLNYPIAILVNKNSASASEILASVIKESYGGFVVGTETYGKGTVQQTTTLPDGSMVKYTVQKWLTPDGNWINETGVEPTDYVDLCQDYYDNPIVQNDNQLQKAIELLTQ